MNKNSSVYIVVLNWNNYKDTIECIRSLQKTTYHNYEIIIVDNGSTNDSQKILEEEFPEIKLIQTGKNLGYSGGNNRGIKYALEHGADLIWVLNPDTLVDPQVLTELVRGMSGSGVGIAVPKIYYRGSPQTVWFVDSRLNMRTGQADHLFFGQADEGQFDEAHYLEWAPGTSLLIKRQVLEKIGLFDERYFLFYEDVDLCVRARRAGFKIAFAPKAKIWHKVGSTVGEKNPANEYYKTRNRLYFVKKFNPPVWSAGFTALYGLRLVARVAKSKITGKDKEFVQAAGDGFFDFLTNNYGIRR